MTRVFQQTISLGFAIAAWALAAAAIWHAQQPWRIGLALLSLASLTLWLVLQSADGPTARRQINPDRFSLAIPPLDRHATR